MPAVETPRFLQQENPLRKTLMLFNVALCALSFLAGDSGKRVGSHLTAMTEDHQFYGSTTYRKRHPEPRTLRTGFAKCPHIRSKLT